MASGFDFFISPNILGTFFESAPDIFHFKNNPSKMVQNLVKMEIFFAFNGSSTKKNQIPSTISSLILKSEIEMEYCELWHVHII